MQLDEFLGAASPWKALALWLGGPGALQSFSSRRELALRLNRDVASLDGLLNAQVNEILHHPRFQKLEASWRGLRYLVDYVDELGDDTGVRVRVLNASWKEIERDFERAIEFDQSQLFRKIYNEEFGAPGGEPFGLLLCDYEVRHRPGPDHPSDDIAVLEAISGCAAAAFAPAILGAHPTLFGIDVFRELELPLDLSAVFRSPEYVRWRAFRASTDSRFVGLTVPRVLMRPPYRDGARRDGFRFREDAASRGTEGYLWGTAVYAFGAVVARAFAESGWLADVRGVRVDEEGGGLVPPLPGGDGWMGPLTPRPSTDVVITSRMEKELSELGFLVLCHVKLTGRSVFYGCDSIHEPETYDDAMARMNAKISSMLHYLLCASRFAHYVKVMVRDKIGRVTTAEECERLLSRWLLGYATGADDISPEMMAKHPLREFKVDVKELPGKPGSFRCVVHLRPHFQLDHVVSSVKLVTELAQVQGS